MSHIEQLLLERIGLDVKSVGSTLIERAVRLRMKRLSLKESAEYASVLAKSSKEFDELTEAVVVTETWFFRDEESFKALTKFIFEEWGPKHLGKRVRILSVPCSTGEEPYSIAMALLDAGLPAQSFHIDAVDISDYSLERARIAVYGKNSFRGKDLQFRDRYFTQTSQGSLLKESVRNNVHFQSGNFLDWNFLTASDPYHFIFCRNLLIYFDAAAQTKVFDRLKHLLAPNGLLFFGPAELPLAVSHGFVSANIPLAFACRKVEPVHTAPAAFPATFTKKTGAVVALPDLAAKDKFSAPPNLDAARKLAEAGRWSEAADFCDAYLRFHGASATVFHLLGQAHEAGGDLAEAEACYRKALYLEPNHQETLSQMVVLSEKKGDRVQVRVFQRRVKRAEGKSTKV